MDKPYDEPKFDKGFTLAVGVFSITLILLVFLQSALFSFQHLELTGELFLNEGDLLQIADITYGESIFNIDLRAARERLAAHAQIEAVELHRRLPSTLVIHITEREPVGIVPHVEGFAAIDKDGIIIMLSDALRLPFPLLTSTAHTSPLALPLGAAVDPTVYGKLLSVASALPQDLVAAVSEVHLKPDGLDLLMRGGGRVLLGDTTQLDVKLQTLRALLASLAKEQRTVEQIDVRVPRTPVLR